MRRNRWIAVVVLFMGLCAAGARAQNVSDTAAAKQQLKQQEKADKAQAKADKAEKKALGTKQQKKADKAQDKANKKAEAAGTPPQ